MKRLWPWRTNCPHIPHKRLRSFDSIHQSIGSTRTATASLRIPQTPFVIRLNHGSQHKKLVHVVAGIQKQSPKTDAPIEDIFDQTNLNARCKLWAPTWQKEMGWLLRLAKKVPWLTAHLTSPSSNCWRCMTASTRSKAILKSMSAENTGARQNRPAASAKPRSSVPR